MKKITNQFKGLKKEKFCIFVNGIIFIMRDERYCKRKINGESEC